MPHAKLSQFITRSSLWREPDFIRVVFIAFLANKDENGYVEGTYDWIKGESNLTDDNDGKKFAFAIKSLESPDPESKNKEYEGRRIIKVDGGWIVTGHDKYRMREDEIREQTRNRVIRFREKAKNTAKNDNVTHCNTCNVTPPLSPVSVSVSVSESVSELKDKEKTSTKLEQNTIPPTHEMVDRYCKERRNGIDTSGFLDFYTSKNWMIGKNQMKDWQAAIRTWEKNQKKESSSQIITVEMLQAKRKEDGFI